MQTRLDVLAALFFPPRYLHTAERREGGCWVEAPTVRRFLASQVMQCREEGLGEEGGG